MTIWHLWTLVDIYYDIYGLMVTWRAADFKSTAQMACYVNMIREEALLLSNDNDNDNDGELEQNRLTALSRRPLWFTPIWKSHRVSGTVNQDVIWYIYQPSAMWVTAFKVLICIHKSYLALE